MQIYGPSWKSSDVIIRGVMNTSCHGFDKIYLFNAFACTKRETELNCKYGYS